MAFTIRHLFESLKSDGIDVSLVQPSDWNDDHVISMDAYTLVGRASGAGDASGLPFSWFHIPIAGIIPFAGSVVPDASWLLCDGSAISRVTYSELFTAIGTTYGVGDGATTFNIPDLRGRVPVGKDPTGTRLTNTTMSPNGNTLGATGGAQTETASLVGGATTGGATAGSISVIMAGATDVDNGGGTTVSGPGAAPPVEVAAHTHNHNFGTLVGSTSGQLSVPAQGVSGTTSAANNVQPSLMVNYIMRVLRNP